jgi:membrane protein required for colicin V production
MNGADHLFAIILLASGVLGFVRGFIREAVSLLTWLVALWLAWHYSEVVNPWLGGALAEPGIREWAGRAIVLLIVLLIGSVIGSIAGYFAQRAAGLAAVDRVIGVTFGLVRGIVIIGLIVIAGRAVHLNQEAWWAKTRSMPIAESIANWLERYAEPAAAELVEQAAEKPGT